VISNAKAGLVMLGFAAATTFAGPAAAQDMGFYAGAAFGQAETDGVCDIAAGFVGVSCDEKDTAWKIFGGYQVNRNFSVELGYANFGEATVTGPGGTATIEGNAFDLVAVGSLPLADRFSVYGKLGLYRADFEVSNTLGFSEDASETGLTFGVGLRFDITRNLAARLEWQRYQEVGDDLDVSMMSLGVLFKF
jgi:OOP family OmpA-OmpF porin